MYKVYDEMCDEMVGTYKTLKEAKKEAYNVQGVVLKDGNVIFDTQDF